MPFTGFPAGVELNGCTMLDARRSRLVGRYPGWQCGLHRLPRHLFQGAQWLIDGDGTFRCRLLDRCGGSAGGSGLVRPRLLLPVELRCVNRGASTNRQILN